MNHSIIKRVIYDQIEVIKSAEIVDRGYSFQKGINYILVGLRRAGKSTLLYKMVKDLIAEGCDWSQIVYINFEDDRLLGFSMDDFDDVVETAHELADSKEIYYFFDEIQVVAGWEHFARRMADHKQRVQITGSNAKMLSSEMSSTLGGRYVPRMVMPFSFREALDYKKTAYDEAALLTTSKVAKIKRACGEYINCGGLPEAQLLTNPREYLKSVYDKVLLGDIIVRESVDNTAALQLMVKKIAETVCSEISYTKLCGNVKTAGTDTSTMRMILYSTYAENAYLLFKTKNYVAKFAEKESNPRFYFTDNGILSLFLVDKTSSLLENAVAVHLKRKYEEGVYYYRSSQTGVDIDFYLPEEDTVIQVAYELGEAEEREVKSLLSFARRTKKAHRLIIVTYEEEKTIRENGFTIEVIPAYKFFLT